jgi:hypothetical protein
MMHLDAVDLSADDILIDVKERKSLHAASCEHIGGGECATEVSGTYDDGVVALADTEQLADLGYKILDVIAVALLSEAAEAVEILSDLRRGDIHYLRELGGGDAESALLEQIREISVISWKSFNYCL